MIILQCNNCNKTFTRSKREYNRNLKLGQRVYCSSQCQRQCRTSVTVRTCLSCGAETKNPKFCSRSCSTSFNNSRANKRPLLGFCNKCEKPCSSSRKYCPLCWSQLQPVDYNKRTLKDCKSVYGSRNSYLTCIRQHARTVAVVYGLLTECKKCGYTLCVQCCHIKPVSSFPEDTTLGIINSPDNLIGLCPNHHWELDNGHLILD